VTVQVQRECEELKRQCREAGSEGERQKAVLRREVRQKTQELSTALKEAGNAKLKVVSVQRSPITFAM
jgi:hypothetical protein